MKANFWSNKFLGYSRDDLVDQSRSKPVSGGNSRALGVPFILSSL
jgi:hypothetical protein